MKKAVLSGIFLIFSSILFAEVLKELAPQEAMTLWELIKNGGVVMFVIMALSIFTITLLLRFIFTLRTFSMVPPHLVAEVRKHLLNGDRDSALRLCNTHDSFISRLIKTAIENSSSGRKEAEEATERAGRTQATLLSQSIRYLADIGVIAPMLGLLGTVLGMIRAFLLITFESGVVRHIMIAGGISQALVTTAAGLIVGIPAMAFYFFFRNKLQRIVSISENISSEILKLIPEGEER